MKICVTLPKKTYFCALQSFQINEITPMEINAITESILKCAFKVHTRLGPGLLENAYEECLHYELIINGLYTERQKPMPLIYDDVKMDTGYRLDFMIERAVVVEIKAIQSFNAVHIAQVLTYLKLSQCHVGLLINFNVASLKTGIKRLVL